MNNVLFNDSEVFQRQRPNYLTPEQKRNFLLQKAEEIIHNNWSEDDKEEIANDLAQLIPFSGNGYRLAKEIEKLHCTYDIDVDFCEFLDSIYHDYLLEIDRNVKDWVKAHNIKPKYDKGTEVLLKNKIYGIKPNTVVFITGMYEDKAIYLIHEDKNRNGGYLVAYETLEKSIN